MDSKEDWVLGLFLAVVVAFAAGFLSYTFGLENGYEKGIKHAELFYEQTGEWPSDHWIFHNAAAHHKDWHDIWESLDEIKAEAD